MYSGGLENFIRLSESWQKWNCSGNSCTPLDAKYNLTVNGTLDILWTAKTLVDAVGKPAYWLPTTYDAPNRSFRYATQIRKDGCLAPGIPETIQMNPEGFKQE